VMMIVVVVVGVMMCIMGERNQCWFHSQTRTPTTNKSRYVIVGPLPVLPTQLLTTSSTDYCPKENGK